ncbi:hypothetical protein SYNPS1DRAFT_27018 [Syncephalis pseudoplumigaleata]|uniref:Protein kinase domain-containing protein n=1 Tax=Syncephalis pseudoplumigaleata TaxID=1712513 RepID=A0A4P9Z4H4_9FUNG|nr:hypothetical protein SYNPS1DRAFT_27018 [Syncephalis pseudoplumigaleata]|eukprot:RKP27318.1 hypothetical protein SYNPS1DRAFT_27018 [Syncephalis pseudoplumigaleata]
MLLRIPTVLVGALLALQWHESICTALPRYTPNDFNEEQHRITISPESWAYGQPELIRGFKIDDNVYEASYQGRPAVLHCGDVKASIARENEALDLIDDAIHAPYTAYSRGRRFIATRITNFTKPGGECTIYNSAGTMTLAQYAEKLSLPQKSRFLPMVFNQVRRGLRYLLSIGIAHTFITPDTILVRHPRFRGKPRVTIFKYALYQPVTLNRKKQCAPIAAQRLRCDERYCAPEHFASSRSNSPMSIDACLFDTWNLGTLIYSVLPHKGDVNVDYVDIRKKETLIERWEKIRADTRRWIASSPFTSNEDRAAMQSLMPLYDIADSLMTVDPAKRPSLFQVKPFKVTA